MSRLPYQIRIKSREGNPDIVFNLDHGKCYKAIRGSRSQVTFASRNDIFNTFPIDCIQQLFEECVVADPPKKPYWKIIQDALRPKHLAPAPETDITKIIDFNNKLMNKENELPTTITIGDKVWVKEDGYDRYRIGSERKTISGVLADLRGERDRVGHLTWTQENTDRWNELGGQVKQIEKVLNNKSINSPDKLPIKLIIDIGGGNKVEWRQSCVGDDKYFDMGQVPLEYLTKKEVFEKYSAYAIELRYADGEVRADASEPMFDFSEPGFLAGTVNGKPAMIKGNTADGLGIQIDYADRHLSEKELIEKYVVNADCTISREELTPAEVKERYPDVFHWDVKDRSQVIRPVILKQRRPKRARLVVLK